MANYIADTLFVGKSNRIYLIDTNITEAQAGCTVTMINSLGTVVNDSNGVAISNRSATWDVSELKYRYDFTFESDQIAGYYRVFWKATDANGRQVVLEDFNSPAAVKILNEAIYTEELVTPAWFVDTFLPLVPLGAVTFDQIREIVRAAQGDLERDVQTYFSKRLISEKHDLFQEVFRQNFWLQQLHHSPAQSVESLELKYGDTEIATIDSDYIMLDQDMGTVEVMPTQAGYFYTLLSSGLNFSYNSMGGFDRIPLFFNISYYAGLDWENLPSSERDSIINAVGRRAVIYILPRLDENMGLSSSSMSIDGASESRSYTSSAMYGQYSAQIEQFKKDEELWIQTFRRKYHKDFVMSIA